MKLYDMPSLAMAAHELKAPLALIRQLSLLLQADPDLSPREGRRLLEQMTLTSERSLRLVEMLTRHARLEDGLFEVEPIQVTHICEEVAHELTPLCQAAGHRLEVRVPRRGALAVANRELLRSILFGLCDNALTQVGMVNEPIVLSAHHHASNVRLAVRDFGPRMRPQDFKRLHERLGRSAQPLGRRPSSSGLGLYIAGQFAAAMHGTLGVIRHRRAGATFYIDTPTSAQLSFLSV